MLRNVKEIEGYAVSAIDGEIGHVVDFLFDDDHWTVRYLVVETGGIFSGRQVLISPISFRQVDWFARRFHLALSIESVKNSPSIDLHKPVSRQHERDYNQYFNYPFYWEFSGLWGLGAYPAQLTPGLRADLRVDHSDKMDDIHLRSSKEVRGYHVHGTDEAVGHIEDFIVDDASWSIRYLVIDTANWGWGKKVLLVPHWANRISWEDRTVTVAVNRKTIEGCPAWSPDQAVNREYETHLYDYYGRPAYWDGSGAPISPPRVHHAGGHQS